MGSKFPPLLLAWMDYHLDWIAASLWAYENPESVGKAVYDEDEEATGTQQDIDLLIAFKAEVRDHLVLLEAKGDDAWRRSGWKKSLGTTSLCPKLGRPNRRMKC